MECLELGDSGSQGYKFCMMDAFGFELLCGTSDGLGFFYLGEWR